MWVFFEKFVHKKRGFIASFDSLNIIFLNYFYLGKKWDVTTNGNPKTVIRVSVKRVIVTASVMYILWKPKRYNNTRIAIDQTEVNAITNIVNVFF